MVATMLKELHDQSLLQEVEATTLLEAINNCSDEYNEYETMDQLEPILVGLHEAGSIDYMKDGGFIYEV